MCVTISLTSYNAVRRWTKDTEIIKKAKVFIPVNHDHHWTLAVINFACQRIEYYDSLGSNNSTPPQVLVPFLQHYARDEARAHHQTLDTTNWTLYCPSKTELPQQIVLDKPENNNYDDCGVYMLMFLHHLSQDSKFDFSQIHILDIRTRIGLAILTKQLKW